MKKIREIIRLEEQAGLSRRQIAQATVYPGQLYLRPSGKQGFMA